MSPCFEVSRRKARLKEVYLNMATYSSRQARDAESRLCCFLQLCGQRRSQLCRVRRKINLDTAVNVTLANAASSETAVVVQMDGSIIRAAGAVEQHIAPCASLSGSDHRGDAANHTPKSATRQKCICFLG